MLNDFNSEGVYGNTEDFNSKISDDRELRKIKFKKMDEKNNLRKMKIRKLDSDGSWNQDIGKVMRKIIFRRPDSSSDKEYKENLDGLVNQMELGNRYSNDESELTTSKSSKKKKAKGYSNSSSKKKNKDYLLREKTDPSINSYRLSKILIDNGYFIYLDSLRIYNPLKGAFEQIDKHKSIVYMRCLLPKDHKKHINSSTLEDAYKLILTTPEIQGIVDEIPHHRNKINCLNGVLEIKNNYISNHSPEYQFMNCINALYLSKFKIKDSYFYKFIKDITNGDLELQRLIKQVLGYIFSNYNNAKTSFLLYGVPNSGKSVLLRIISYICGEENISNVEFQYLSDKRYTATLFGKLLNISYEIGEAEIKDTGIFKSLVSESDKVSARAVYGQPFSFYNRAKLLFAANNLPQIKTKNLDDYSAFTNRLCILPFTKSISEEDQDKDLFKKLKCEADLIFSWAVEGLKEYIENGFKFSKCTASQEVLNKYKARINSAELFLKERCLVEEGNHTFMYALKEAYENFCTIEGMTPPSTKDVKLLKSLIENSYKLQYKKINRGGENRYAFENLRINND